MSSPLFTTSATAAGGRGGAVTTADNRLSAALSMPRALGGDDGPGTNPEQLFAAGYAACFHNALLLVARQAREAVLDSSVTVTVELLGTVASGLDLGVRIEATIPGLPEAEANELLAAAHQVCPYSRALRTTSEAEVVLVS